MPDIDAAWRRFYNKYRKGNDILLSEYWERDWRWFYKDEFEAIRRWGERRAKTNAKNNQTDNTRREREREAQREKAWDDQKERDLRSLMRNDWLKERDDKNADPRLHQLRQRIRDALDDGGDPWKLADEYWREKSCIMDTRRNQGAAP